MSLIGGKTIPTDDNHSLSQTQINFQPSMQAQQPYQNNQLGLAIGTSRTGGNLTDSDEKLE